MARQPKPSSPPVTGNGLSIKQLVRSTPALMKNNARSVILKSYNPLAQSKSGLPAITAVCVDHVSATQPPRPHKCWFVGMNRNVDTLYNQKKVLFQCDCESYMFTFEYANSVNGASRIMFSNGEPASMTNPTNRPGLCIAEGMMVTTEYGLVPVEKLKVGDRVHTLEGLCTVLVAKQTGTDREIVRVETSLFSNPLYCTPNHEILIYRSNASLEWVEARNIKIDDTILSCSRVKNFEEANWDDFLFSKVLSITPAGTANVYCPQIEDAEHFIANSLLVHNCIAGDELIRTIHGMIPMREIVPGMEVLTSDGTYHPVTHHWQTSEAAPVVEVILKSGISVVCTPDHKLRTLRNNKVLWVPAGKLRTSDAVLSVVDDSSSNLRQLLPDIDYILEENASHHLLPTKIPKYLTLELARLMGYLVSEGSGNRNFGNSDLSLVEDFVACCQKVFGISPKIRKHLPPAFVCRYRTRRIMYGVRLPSFFSAIFAAYGMLDEKGNIPNSYTHVIPFTVLTAPDKYAVEFFKALFAGDGYLSGVVISYDTCSAVLAKQLQAYFRSKGIVFRLTESLSGHADTFMYKLRITGKFYYDKFFAYFGKPLRILPSFTSMHFPENSGKTSRSHLLPLNIKKITGIKGSPGCARINRDRLAEFIVDNKRLLKKVGLYTWLNFYIRKDVIFENVKRVKFLRKPQDVYDMTVESIHNFTVNGIVCLNCKHGVRLAEEIIQNSD